LLQTSGLDMAIPSRAFRILYNTEEKKPFAQEMGQIYNP